MLKDKVAIVTGSTSGIGLGIAEEPASQGAHIVLNGFGDAHKVEAIRSGIERVSREVYDAATPEERRRMIVDTIWNGMLAATKGAEEEFPNEPGPWTDFGLGMLYGKLSAIRRVLGDERDMPDT